MAGSLARSRWCAPPDLRGSAAERRRTDWNFHANRHL